MRFASPAYATEVVHGAAVLARAVQAKATFASVGTPNLAVCRAGRPEGKCLRYSALHSA